MIAGSYLKRWAKPLRLLAAAAALLPFLLRWTAAQGDAVVVISASDTGPYREAVDGFVREFGPVPTLYLSRGSAEPPSGARVVVTFGAKAAMVEPPSGAVLVYALAPGMEIRSPKAVRISMLADPGVLMAHLKSIQPGLRRLGVLWSGTPFRAFVGLLGDAAKSQGVGLDSVAVDDKADLPDRLRELHGRVDAIFVLPDPLLIDAESLDLLIDFSRENGIPLYVSTRGLLDQGATAAVGPTFGEMGRLAAQAARRLLAGGAAATTVYSTHPEDVVSRSAAARVGLGLPAAAAHIEVNP